MTSLYARTNTFPILNGTEVYSLPPPGYHVNFDHPAQTQNAQHYAAFAIGIVVASVALIQRLYTKHFLAKGLQVDDLFMFVSWSVSTAVQITLIWQVAVKALGVHVYEMPLDRFVTYSKVTYSVTPLFGTATCFAKVSLAMFYLKLSPKMWFRTACWITLAVIFCNWFILSMITIFKCNPMRLGYDVRLKAVADKGTCIDSARVYMTIAGMNIFTDVLLFLLPIPMILHLRLANSQKIGAIVIFAVASLTVCTSCFRCAYIVDILNTTDPPWDGARADLWAIVELNLSVVCGSTPTLRKFFKHFFPRLMTNASSRFSSAHSTSGRDTTEHNHTKQPTMDDISLDDIIEITSHEDHDSRGDSMIYDVVNIGGAGSSKGVAVNVREKQQENQFSDEM